MRAYNYSKYTNELHLIEDYIPSVFKTVHRYICASNRLAVQGETADATRASPDDVAGKLLRAAPHINVFIEEYIPSRIHLALRVMIVMENIVLSKKRLNYASL